MASRGQLLNCMLPKTQVIEMWYRKTFFKICKNTWNKLVIQSKYKSCSHINWIWIILWLLPAPLIPLVPCITKLTAIISTFKKLHFNFTIWLDAHLKWMPRDVVPSSSFFYACHCIIQTHTWQFILEMLTPKLNKMLVI